MLIDTSFQTLEHIYLLLYFHFFTFKHFFKGIGDTHSNTNYENERHSIDFVVIALHACVVHGDKHNCFRCFGEKVMIYRYLFSAVICLEDKGYPRG